MHVRIPVAALLLAVLALATFSAGCADDPAAPTGPSVSPGETPAVAGTPVAPEVLARFVPPAPAGWRLEAPPSTMALDEDGMPLLSVTASYTPVTEPNGTAAGDADLVIQDTGGQPIGFRKLVDLLASAPPGTDGLDRTTLRGHRAFEVRDERSASSYILVADRYVVYLSVSGTPADYDAFVAALDLDGLSRLR